MIAAACRDAIAPTRSVSESNLAVLSGPSAAARKAPQDRHVFEETFLIPAAGGRLRVGDFWLDFPARSVCKLNSGYGKRFWDKPCETVDYDFRITASFWWENGEALVEFSPDIRFDPSKVVVISTRRPALILQTDIGNYQLWYWTRGENGRSKHDEAALDRSLETFFHPVTGEVFRRIKHFSGISINSGMACDETAGDPDCVPSGDDGIQ